MIALIAAALVATTPVAVAAPDHGPPPSLKQAAFEGPPSRKQIDAILKAPQSVEPMYYVFVSQELWRRGDREQAAFWFYIFQSRTRAWAKSDGTYAQARGALNSVMGQTINEWVGSDLEAMTVLVERALAYEEKFPFFDGKPDGVDVAKWNALMLTERAAYAAEFTEAAKEMLSEKEEWAAARRENGLFVGPWKSRGKPLPEHWR